MLVAPFWMDDAGLMAKSAEFGGETLTQHTWRVLERLSDQVKLRLNLPEYCGERFWSRMYWGCFLHDFGKAANGFQAILRGEDHSWKTHRHRHEVLSLGFVDWLFPKGHIDREWVIGIIASHHKDAEAILDTYGGRHKWSEMTDEDREAKEIMLSDLVQQLDLPTRQLLWRWISECGLNWAENLGIPLVETPQLVSFEEACVTDLKASLFKALRSFAEWQKSLQDDFKVVTMLSRGLILTADHSASAGAGAFPLMPSAAEMRFYAERSLQGLTWRSHQEQAQQAGQGSAIMVAPTGSGKTEAALLWAARQMEQRPVSRLFYTLPYQASMNAMVERLCTRFFDVGGLMDDRNKLITIQHSRARLKFYQDMMNLEEIEPRKAEVAAKRLQNLARLNYFPIQVFSPYQMLKAAYSLKGYETLLVDYTDALFIFDEIHAYEPKRLALIITLMGWLARNCHARFLVMTATLPPMVKQVLLDALPNPEIIEASEEDFQASQRHRVHILEGDLLNQLALACADFEQGKTVLVCCNQIATAQEAYHYFKEEQGIPAEQIVLLHGRFNGKDRSRHEQRITDAVGVRSEQRKRPFLVVATQVVEVSLDVDFDTIYTDPAPLEALLQRFGRVNRGRRQQNLEDVHVFREPSNPTGSSKPYLPYHQNILEQSIVVLSDFVRHDNRIDEGLVTKMLDEIYTGDIRTDWQENYQKSAKSFERDILQVMKPYQSADESMWQRFYKMFDGVQVIPVDCEDDYYAALDKKMFLEAAQYTVNMSYGHYAQAKQRGLIIAKDSETELYDHINAPYDPEGGLDLKAALQIKDEDE